MEVNVEAFIEAVQQYRLEQKRRGDISVKLQRYLQTFCASSDRNVFDPNTNSGAKFFFSLHELMSIVEPNSGLMWFAVETLEEAIKNPAALTQSFKFIPIITELLICCTTNDRRIQVLRLLQSCTYGIKIQRQEAYLKTLISLLIKCTTCSGMNSNLVSLSLGVLVNLCFNNPPAINMTKYLIEDEKLLKTVLAQHKNNLDIRLKACRLMFILREMQGKRPDDGILSGIIWILKKLLESFQSRRKIKLTVDNSRDKQNNIIYQCFKQDIDLLIKLLENVSSKFVMKCTGHLLEFLQALIDLNSPDKDEVVYYRILKMALTLAGVDTRISRCTLHLVQVIIIFSNLESLMGRKNYLLHVLEDYLKVVLSLMAYRANSLSYYKSWMVDLLSLLLECRNISYLQEKISSFLDVSVIKDMFMKDPSCSNFGSTLDSTLNALYIKSFALVSYFSKTSQAWSNLLNDLKGSKELQARFAAALCTGKSEIKRLVSQLLQQMNDSIFYKNVMHAYYTKYSIMNLYSKLRHVMKCGL